MLFPLSKSFSSTRLFQAGGATSEPLKHRAWELDHTGSHKRAALLHELLAEKKPYETHLSLAKAHSDELFQRDLANSRAFNEHLKDISKRLDDQALHERRELRRRIHEYEQLRAESDNARHRELCQQGSDFEAWRRDMEKRVGESPPVWGGPPVRETAERAAQREQARRSVAADSRRYFEASRSLKEALANRPPPPPPHRSGNSPAALEERRAVSLAALSKQGREYEVSLEATYNKHHQRIMDYRRKNEADHAATLEFKASAQLNKTASTLEFTQRSRDEAAQMQQRVKDKPKSFGGYKAVHKSNRRLREELANDDVNSSTLGRANSSASDGNQRTMSPRTLAAGAAN